MAALYHRCRNLRALLGLFALQAPLLIADRPDDDRRRVAVALDHRLKLRQPLGAGAHLPRLAHHHHSHAVAGFNQLWRGHVVRGAHGIAAHLLQDSNAEGLHPIRQSRAHSGVILVVACPLDLHRLPVQEEAVIGVELYGTHAKRDPLDVADSAAGFEADDGGIKVGRVDGPEHRMVDMCRR